MLLPHIAHTSTSWLACMCVACASGRFKEERHISAVQCNYSAIKAQNRNRLQLSPARVVWRGDVASRGMRARRALLNIFEQRRQEFPFCAQTTTRFSINLTSVCVYARSGANVRAMCRRAFKSNAACATKCVLQLYRQMTDRCVLVGVFNVGK